MPPRTRKARKVLGNFPFVHSFKLQFTTATLRFWDFRDPISTAIVAVSATFAYNFYNINGCDITTTMIATTI